MPKGKVPLLISVDDEHLDSFPKVVQNLQSAGLYTKQLMEQLGIVIGYCEPAKVEALSKVEGVSHVEREKDYQIAPPNWAIQ